MSNVRLLFETADERVNNILGGTIGLLEAAFPNRLRACYLTGSYADGSAVPSSDIDLFVLFRRAMRDDEEAKALYVGNCCTMLSPIGIDLYPNAENQLSWFATVFIKHASRLLYGEDIRDKITPVSIEDFARGSFHGCFDFLAELRGVDRLDFPLAYPDPQDEFYGYYRQKRRADGSLHADGKKLVTSVACAATSLIALKARRYVYTKDDCVKVYNESLGGEWADFLSTIYQRGKKDWKYRIPEDAAARRELRELCRQTLAYENDFVKIYRDYLLEELKHDNAEVRLFAARRLGEIVFPDEEIIAALEVAGQAAHDELRQAAQDSLAIVRRSHAAQAA